MKILFVAPEFSLPWTEGRKRFIKDLITELSRKDEVFLVTTTTEVVQFSILHRSRYCRNKFSHIFFLITQLPGAIKEFCPDAVIHFPYGTFRGSRKILNLFMIKMINRISNFYSTPSYVFMYSIDNSVSVEYLKKRVPNMIISSRDDWQGISVNIGRACESWYRERIFQDPLRLLFIAGVRQNTKRQWDYILNERGLGLVLRSGEMLSKERINLIVAAPLFSNQDLVRQLLEHPLNKWPSGQLSVLATVDIPEVFYNADIFLFPYQSDLSHFVPTSIIESMFAGTPVLMSDLPFLKRLMGSANVAYYFDHSNPADFVSAIDRIRKTQGECLKKTHRANLYARETWSIEKSANTLIDLLTKQRAEKVR